MEFNILLNMKVYLTSFVKSVEYNCPKYSVARRQPKGFNYPELKFLAPISSTGEILRLSTFPNDPVANYAIALKEAYKYRWDVIKSWLCSLSEDIALCCWCPYSKSTQRQLKEYGVFVCHTGLVGQMIRKWRPDIEVVLDSDREKLIEEYKP